MSLSAARVVVENRTGIDQRAFVGGDIIRLAPYEMRPVHPDVANAFFNQCGTQVQKHMGAQVPAPSPGDQRAWVANMTGNPFAPKTVKVRRVQKGEEVEIETDNPLCEPAIIRRTHGGGQIELPKSDGTAGRDVFNLSRSIIIIPPYTRVCVSQTLADWLLRRDMQQRIHHVGKLIRAREQTPYEPNESWDLPRLRFYATQILGIGEEFLGKHPREIQNEHEDGEVRSHLLRTMFFRIVDPRVNIPSEEAFSKIYKVDVQDETTTGPTVDDAPSKGEQDAARISAASQRLKAMKGK